MEQWMVESLIDEQGIFFGRCQMFNNGNAFITLAVDINGQTEDQVKHALETAGFSDVRSDGLTWFSTNGRTLEENWASPPASDGAAAETEAT